ncbi:hypothetical protein ACNRWW_16750 [Metabacillus sp. HB246100]|uniref:hypothetical protein n=1 Tax=Bacillus weihaiensis TaxID=1547283 RepID=UPI0023579947|nr:hypothetical protein [Bacillus weihaiensis]
MNLIYSIMLLTLFLSIINFLYGYKEALRVSNAEGPVQGIPLIISLPLGFIFAYLSTVFYQLI